MEDAEHLQYQKTQSVADLCPLHAGTRNGQG